MTSRDVWVTNGELLLGGRLNRQIDELNGSVVASSPAFDVLQDGDTLFMVDPDAGRVESVNPASTEVTSAIDIPQGSEVSYGGDVLAIVSPQGELWAIPAIGDLQFNFVSTPPLVELGVGGHAVVTGEGAVIAVSRESGKLYRVESLVDVPKESAFPSVGEFQLAAVGDQAVVFDQSTNELVNQSGSRFGLGDQRGLRLQQSGPASGRAVVATGDGLVKVDLASGATEVIPANIPAPSSDPTAVAAPVNQAGCAHGAWAESGRYLLACDGAVSQALDIEQPTRGSRLEFRVNRSVIALNDLSNGNVWLMDENMRLVENWDDVIPPVEEESEEEGEEQSSIQTFEDTLAERTEVNRPPTAQDDQFGIRPGRTTILSVLDNDSDPDGDVLVISAFDGVSESTGVLDPIDGGRALQFTPAEGFVGTIAFNYTVDDGRGGTASANVQARVVPDTVNEAPYSVREPGVSVEANQTVSYNVLADWRDPDGDDLYLIAASPKSGDLVRFTPDGFVTFTHQTSELGEKEVVFTVSDGSQQTAQGSLTVKVEPAGSLNPVGTPDFATSFVGETVTVKPLLNDLSPSGAQLSLVGLEEPGGDASASLSADRGEVTFTSSAPGIFYMKYTLQAGANTSVGIIRIDVREKPADLELPPVAVKDTAYLRSEEPVTVSVLSNDVSPTGRILAIQSVSVPPEYAAKGLVVEVLESTLVRITSPAALTEQVNFTYTISDGVSSATAGVTVVPVPALTKHQPPVAANDAATVRVGDITTLDVLDNDFHPDDSTMFLDTTLVTEPDGGIAFISRDRLRFQAPEEPGEYRVDYRVLDPYGESAVATAVFTVTPLDDENNRDPVPAPLIGRVLAGGTIRIDLPLSGIDPDGDSTQLLGFPRSPGLGSIVETGNDYFIYEASPAGAGTDEFSYQVYDALGATGTATIKIAVIPEPSELQPPSAVPDSVSVRPGRVAQVDLLANDSDPQGAPIKISEELIDVPEGIKAEVVDRRYLVLNAPETEQSFSLRYELTNNRGGTALSYVLVQVTPDAPLLPPTADDVPIQTKEIAGKESITVDLFDGFAFNPAGRTEDLTVTLEGPNASAAEVLDSPGLVEVTPQQSRQAIAYRVTNEEDELSAMAFILVPAAVDEDFDSPPYIDPNLPPQYVSMNGEREWNLSDIVIVPSGRDPHIYERGTVTAVQGDGSSSYVDDDTIRIAPPTGYRGPASINFTVSDGDSKDDPKGVEAQLTLNVIIGDPEFRDTPPEFTTPNAQVEVGETTVIDLRASTAHPNPQILQQVTYSDARASNGALNATLNGSQLSLTVPRNTPKGSTYTVDVTLRWDQFTVQGTVNVLVVGSSRPLPVAVTDDYETKRPVGTYTMSPLTNDSNPYQTSGEPLTIVDARITNAENVGTVSFTDDQISITPVSTPQYLVIGIAYTIADATEDPDRQVNGTINFTITDVPAEVGKPSRGGSQYGGDRSASISWTAPATNGKEITSYEVRNMQNGTVATVGGTTYSHTATGLTNGTTYTFQVRAINVNGPGPWSTASDPITPYGTPQQVSPTVTVVDQWGPGGVIRASWPAVAGTGGTTTYYWSASNGASGNTTSLQTPDIGGLAGGSYTVQVYARNEAYQGPTGTSNAGSITNQGIPGTPTITSSSPGNGTTSPSNVSWSWSSVSASPGGTANIQYEVSYNGGGWQGVGAATSYTLNGRGTGDHTLSVRATNKSGPGGASAGVTVTLSTPATVSMCMTGTGPISGSSYFHIYWTGQSGGDHTVSVRNTHGNPQFTSTRTASGSDNGATLGAYAARNTAGDLAQQYRYVFDGSLGPWTPMSSIPMC
ncbi:Ig-like domain-containing protein [Salinibacterium metalliresistens]|uniref:Ig-like domain-containing protein n=1 Tax=Salinibacterium metalliresistens TaxID=3031321 RepID=UPI0023DCC6C4|nr:Ig-like domain-containing protein [Salinibacterium metalliresistens]